MPTNKKWLQKAWETNRTYYEHNGIRDSRIGWTKRLGLAPNAFGNRLKLWKAGKIPKDEVFRKAHTPSSKKYETKLSKQQISESRRGNVQKRWAKTDRVPPCHTIRVWETVFQALKALKPKAQKWNQFFIEGFKLEVNG